MCDSLHNLICFLLREGRYNHPISLGRLWYSYLENTRDVPDVQYLTSREVPDVQYLTSRDIPDVQYLPSRDVPDVQYLTSRDIPDVQYLTSRDVPGRRFLFSRDDELLYLVSNFVLQGRPWKVTSNIQVCLWKTISKSESSSWLSHEGHSHSWDRFFRWQDLATVARFFYENVTWYIILDI